jgi:hypothetical protein
VSGAIGPPENTPQFSLHLPGSFNPEKYGYSRVLIQKGKNDNGSILDGKRRLS